MRRDLEREREFKRREAAENEEALRRGERELLEKNRRLADEKWRAEKEAEEQARERSRREQEKKKAAEEKRRAEREAEERARERSRREHEKKMAAEEARTREVERQSKAEYERQLQERLDQDMQIMIQKSLDEAARKKKEEEEEIQRALRESARLEHMERKYQEDAIRSTRTDIPIRTAAPPSPPATPPMKSMPPPPPAPAPVPKPAVAKSAPRPPPAPKPATVSRETNYALPPVGEQKIGRFKLGGRSVPIHESQDIPDTPTTSGIPMSPSSPAPFARLGGAIAPSDMPIMRELKGQVPPVVPAAMDSKAGLRKTGGPRKVPPPVPERMGVDPKLAALLAKQRAWEPEDDDEMGAKTVTPPESPSGIQARRLSPVEFDIKRKSGWKKEEE
ncbi:unnamed protein product [Alternaria alternata]